MTCPKCNSPGCSGVHAQANLIVPCGMLMIAMQIENLFPIGFSFLVDPANPTQQVMTFFHNREQAREFVDLFKRALDDFDKGALQPKTGPAN